MRLTPAAITGRVNSLVVEATPLMVDIPNSVEHWKAYNRSSNTLKKQWKAPIFVSTKAAKIVTTRCVFRATNIRKCVCSAPDTAGGAYSAPPDPLAGFRGRGREGSGRERVKGCLLYTSDAADE